MNKNQDSNSRTSSEKGRNTTNLKGDNTRSRSTQGPTATKKSERDSEENSTRRDSSRL